MWKDFVGEGGPFKQAADLITATTSSLSDGVSDKISNLQTSADNVVNTAVAAAQGVIN
jgi:hypothetical protein